MKNNNRYFIALLSFITTIFLIGCSGPAKVALTTDDMFDGRDAVEKLTDQTVLTKIALEANLSEVRGFAVGKLIDQSILNEIAFDTTKNHVVRSIALGKVIAISQTVLEKIYWEDKNSSMQRAALDQLSDSVILKKIVLKSERLVDREIALRSITDPIILTKFALVDTVGWKLLDIAIEKLSDTTLLANVADIDSDKQVQLMYKFINAFDDVPEDHRLRLIKSIFPAIRVLNWPNYKNKFGEIVSIEIAWSSNNRQYSKPFATTSMTKPGESIECSIKLMNLTEPVSHRWSTAFPRDLMITGKKLTFSPAEIKAWDLYGPVKKLLTQ